MNSSRGGLQLRGVRVRLALLGLLAALPPSWLVGCGSDDPAKEAESLIERVRRRTVDLATTVPMRDLHLLFGASAPAQSTLRAERAGNPKSDWPRIEKESFDRWAGGTELAASLLEKQLLRESGSGRTYGADAMLVVVMRGGAQSRVEEVRDEPKPASASGRVRDSARHTVSAFVEVTYADPEHAVALDRALIKRLKARLRFDGISLDLLTCEILERGTERFAGGDAAMDRALGKELAARGLKPEAITILAAAHAAGRLDEESAKRLGRLRYEALPTTALQEFGSWTALGAGYEGRSNDSSIFDLDPSLRGEWVAELVGRAERNLRGEMGADARAATAQLVSEARRVAAAPGAEALSQVVARRTRELALRVLRSDSSDAIRAATAVSRDQGVLNRAGEIITDRLVQGSRLSEDLAMAIEERIEPSPDQSFVWAARAHQNFEIIRIGGPSPALVKARAKWADALQEAGEVVPSVAQKRAVPQVRGLSMELKSLERLRGGILRMRFDVHNDLDTESTLSLPVHPGSAEKADYDGGGYLVRVDGSRTPELAWGRMGASAPVGQAGIQVPPRSSVEIWRSFVAPSLRGDVVFRHVCGGVQLGFMSMYDNPIEKRAVDYKIAVP